MINPLHISKLDLTGLRETTIQLNSNWVFQIANKLVLLSFIVSITIIIWRYQLLPPQIPLWYSRPWGTDRLGPQFLLLILPISAVIWHSINILISIYITRDHRVFSQVLFLGSLFVSLLSLVSVVKIIFLIS
jgi:hypothetical protein